jgi:hypothetical protein
LKALTSESGASPQPSVICSENSSQSEKKLESPRRFWNNIGRNTSSLFQTTEAFE